MFGKCDIIISYAINFKITFFVIYTQETLVNDYFYNLEIKGNLRYKFIYE